MIFCFYQAFVVKHDEYTQDKTMDGCLEIGSAAGVDVEPADLKN